MANLVAQGAYEYESQLVLTSRAAGHETSDQQYRSVPNLGESPAARTPGHWARRSWLLFGMPIRDAEVSPSPTIESAK